MAGPADQLMALLQGLQQTNSRVPQRGSALSFLDAMPQPQPMSGAGITPEELAAVAAAGKAPAADGPSGTIADIFAAVKKVAEPEEEGKPSLLQQIFSGMGQSSQQAAGQGSLAQATADAQATAASHIPVETFGPPIPPGGTYGPPVPSATDYLRHATRTEFNLDPVTGAPLPLPGPVVVQPDPMAPESYGPGRTLPPEALAVLPGGNVGGPRPEGDGPPGGINIIDVLKGAVKPNSAAEALFSGNFGEILPRMGATVSRGATEMEQGGTAEKTAAAPEKSGPPKAFTYKFPGAAGTAEQTRMTDITVDTRTGEIVPSGQGAAPDRTAVIDSYMPKMIGAESGGKMVPNAAGASSAFGPAQFTEGTWIDTVKENDPATYKSLGGDRNAILALRKDPDYHNKMARSFTEGNANILDENKIPVTPGNLYAMHFFGRGDGPKVLKASDTTPIEQVVDAASIKANPHLKGMTVGQAKSWADNTVAGQKGQGNAYGMPERTPREVGQLPEPPQMALPVGVDYSAVLEEMKKAQPKKAEAMGGLDQLVAILGGMAKGAASAPGSDWGRVIAGLGGGGAEAASALTALERGDTEAYNQAVQRMAIRMAGVKENQAVSQANTTNAQSNTKFNNQRSIYETAVRNSELSRAESNAAAEYKDKVNWAAWEKGQPQVTANDKGISIITRTPEGKINIKTQSYKNFDNEVKRVKELAALQGEDDIGVKSQMYKLAAEQGGELGVRRAMLMNIAEQAGLKDILGATEYEKLKKEVDASIPKAAIMEVQDNKGYTKLFTQRATDILMRSMMDPDPKKRLPDTWIEALARQGDPAALAMMQAAQGK